MKLFSIAVGLLVVSTLSGMGSESTSAKRTYLKAKRTDPMVDVEQKARAAQEEKKQSAAHPPSPLNLGLSTIPGESIQRSNALTQEEIQAFRARTATFRTLAQQSVGAGNSAGTVRQFMQGDVQDRTVVALERLALSSPALGQEATEPDSPMEVDTPVIHPQNQEQVGAGTAEQYHEGLRRTDASFLALEARIAEVSAASSARKPT